jgi:hypothetical protein
MAREDKAEINFFPPGTRQTNRINRVDPLNMQSDNYESTEHEDSQIQLGIDI